MSKRGNCWDNASIESFFSRYKYDFNYTNSKNLLDLQVKSKQYINYYNNKRPQLTRKLMTPTEYEIYLNSLNKEDFSKYLFKEQQKYDTMKQKAIEKCSKRMKDIGV